MCKSCNWSILILKLWSKNIPDNFYIEITCDVVYDTTMIRAVLDTNVIVAALKSSKGASYEIIRLADLGVFQPVLSVSLLTEYEDVLHRPEMEIPLSSLQIDSVLDRLCKISVNQTIHYLWRPFLSDYKDDMVFEAALASGAPFIVTFNHKDFQATESMGVTTLSPRDFLLKL